MSAKPTFFARRGIIIRLTAIGYLLLAFSAWKTLNKPGKARIGVKWRSFWTAVVLYRFPINLRVRTGHYQRLPPFAAISILHSEL